MADTENLPLLLQRPPVRHKDGKDAVIKPSAGAAASEGSPTKLHLTINASSFSPTHGSSTSGGQPRSPLSPRALSPTSPNRSATSPTVSPSHQFQHVASPASCCGATTTPAATDVCTIASPIAASPATAASATPNNAPAALTGGNTPTGSAGKHERHKTLKTSSPAKPVPITELPRWNAKQITPKAQKGRRECRCPWHLHVYVFIMLCFCTHVYYACNTAL